MAYLIMVTQKHTCVTGSLVWVLPEMYFVKHVFSARY